MLRKFFTNATTVARSIVTPHHRRAHGGFSVRSKVLAAVSALLMAIGVTTVIGTAAAAHTQDLTVVTKRQPTEDELRAMKFAWRVCKHVKSNAMVFSSGDRLLAQGGGQTSRVDSTRIAAQRGGEALKGSAAASDAFFPFRDGLDELEKAGAKCVVQPGGSVRDQEVIAAADEHGIAMVFTGVRHFRH